MRLAVEPRHHRARGGKRALDPRHEVADQALVDRELAVGEQLDQHRAQQRVVGRRQRDDRERLEPRAEIADRKGPSRRRACAR